MNMDNGDTNFISKVLYLILFVIICIVLGIFLGKCILG